MREDTSGDRLSQHESNGRLGRRTFLRSVSAAALIGGGGGLAAGERGGQRGSAPSEGSSGRGGVPPAPLTEWGPSVSLGEGSATTFTTETPSGEPRAHGLLVERSALKGLPSADTLAASDEYDDKYGPDGLAATIHGKTSQEFFIPVPSAAGTSITFVGLNWNPGGHPPPSVYTVPHFDVHFHRLPMATVDAIEGPVLSPFDVPSEIVPAGYARAPDPKLGGPAVITDMGEHLVDFSAPEFNGEPFTNTLIWGVGDPDDDGTGELTFVEPMLTKAYLKGLSGTDRRPIPQPAAPGETGPWPTSYSVRDLPSQDAIAITIEDFA